MKPKRKLYKIGHLTKLLGITSRTVRYYDQFGLLPHVKRSDGHIRLFDDEDVEIIKKIRRLQHEDHLPLDEIKLRLFGSKRSKQDLKAIVTDSTAALSPEIIKSLNIHVIPMYVHIGSEKILAPDITTKELWQKSLNLAVETTTSPPDVETFSELYQKLANEGVSEIYSIHLTGKFSKTIENAKLAAHRVSNRVKVRVVDSPSTGAGLGLLVQAVAASAQNGASVQEIELLISKNIPMVYDVLTVHSLKYLVAAGKFSSANENRQNLLQKLFEFKPVLRLKNGELEILSCCKTKNEAMEIMLNLLDEEIVSRGKYISQICIIYNYLYGEALELVNAVKQKYAHIPVNLLESSVILSVYVGPESLGISLI